MADNKSPGYSLVPGDGGRTSSGLISRRIAEEGGSGGGFLDLSLGSIYNNPSADDDDGFSPVPRTLFPAAAVPSVVTAATAPYTPPPATASAPAFALDLPAASSAVTAVDGGNGGAPISVLTAAANQGLVAPAPAPFVLPPLFTSDGIVSIPVPVPVPVHGNAYASATVPAASDIFATPAAPRAVAALLGASPPSSAPPPSNRKAPRGRRRRRRSGDASGDDDAGAADSAVAPTNGGGESSTPPPFPWASKTAGAAHHPTLAELTERGIGTVEGEVCCKRCDAGKTISYDIRAKFEELSGFILRNVEAMHDRAPPQWMSPPLPDCDKCGQKNSLRPVIAAEKWRINWLFLLLGQTLGLCTLEQLKHFCASTRQHRTGAKDRVLYSTYMELCNQLCPGGPFDMASERKNRTRPFA